MLNSELMVAGAMLGDYHTVPLIRSQLGPDDFYSDEGRAVYMAACSLADEHKQIDPVTIRRRADEMGTHIDDVYIIRAMDVAATQASLLTHIAGMKEGRVRGMLMGALESARLRIMAEEDPRLVCADLQAQIEAASAAASDRLQTAAEMMLQLAEHRQMIDEGKRMPCIPTGYTGIDNALGGGLVANGLHILAARPGQGKTTMGLQIADMVAKRGTPVLFVSLEMTSIQISAKLIGTEVGLQPTRVMMHPLADDEYVRLANGMDVLKDRPLFFSRDWDVSVGSIGVMARQVRDCGLVVIDYLGLMRLEPGENRYAQMTNTSRALKLLAKSLGIPLLVLSQLNREVEGQNRAPRPSDIRDSGAIEQDADSIILLHRPQDTRPVEDGAAATLVATVAKSRYGRAGKEVELAWYMSSGRVMEVVSERPQYF